MLLFLQIISISKVIKCMMGLEEAYQQAHNFNVKGVLITNPSNPLIRHYNEPRRARPTHHFRCCSGTVFENPSFLSIIEAVMNRKLEKTKLWSRVHIVYSLSKDLGF